MRRIILKSAIGAIGAIIATFDIEADPAPDVVFNRALGRRLFMIQPGVDPMNPPAVRSYVEVEPFDLPDESMVVEEAKAPEAKQPTKQPAPQPVQEQTKPGVVDEPMEFLTSKIEASKGADADLLVDLGELVLDMIETTGRTELTPLWEAAVAAREKELGDADPKVAIFAALDAAKSKQELRDIGAANNIAIPDTIEDKMAPLRDFIKGELNKPAP